MIQIHSLQDIELLKESEDLECKKAAGRDGKGELPKDFWETYSAMANTNGGIVLLGVKETKKGFEIHSINNVESIKKQLVDLANNRQKVSVNLISNDSFKVIEIEGNYIIQISIPRAPRSVRPVFLNNTPFGNTYRRVYEADQVVSDDIVKRYLAEQLNDSLDDCLLKGFYLEALNMDSLKSYRQVFSNRAPESPWNSHDDITFLQCIGAWKKDRETGEQGLTLAGLLMFGNHPEIQEVLPYYMLDYREGAPLGSEQRWLDRLTLDGNWSGNLYDFYKKVFLKLTENIKIPFQTQQSKRIDETSQHIAIREALCNVLVHADYQNRASILVEKRPDMLGFRNPGLMRIPIEIALQGGEPDCRNRKLHQMFRYVGIGDQAGSGLPKILQTWKEHHWKTPRLYEKKEPYDQTILEMRMTELFPEGVMDSLKSFLGSAFDEVGYIGQVALAIALTEGTVSHDRLKLNTDAHPSDLSKVLCDLINRGILEKTGLSKGAIYHIVGIMLPNPEDVFESSPIIDASSPIIDASSPIIDASSPIMDASSPIMDVEYLKSIDSRSEDGSLLSEHHSRAFIDNLSILSKELYSKLIQVAEEPRAKKRVSPEVMKQVILNLCQDHFITISSLSELLNREPETLRGGYLSSMVREGVLILAFPKTPNDPRQAYAKA